MFICQITQKMSKPCEKLNRIVVQRREKIYTEFVRNEETNQFEEQVVGTGSECVREINASEEGLRLWTAWTEDERAVFLRSL